MGENALDLRTHTLEYLRVKGTYFLKVILKCLKMYI